jgi:hypothetical protein
MKTHDDESSIFNRADPRCAKRPPIAWCRPTSRRAPARGPLAYAPASDGIWPVRAGFSAGLWAGFSAGFSAGLWGQFPGPVRGQSWTSLAPVLRESWGESRPSHRGRCVMLERQRSGAAGTSQMGRERGAPGGLMVRAGSARSLAERAAGRDLPLAPRPPRKPRCAQRLAGNLLGARFRPPARSRFQSGPARGAPARSLQAAQRKVSW